MANIAHVRRIAVGLDKPVKPIGNGEYRTSTWYCHGGDTEYGLVFGVDGNYCHTRGCTGEEVWVSLEKAAGITRAERKRVARERKAMQAKRTTSVADVIGDGRPSCDKEGGVTFWFVAEGQGYLAFRCEAGCDKPLEFYYSWITDLFDPTAIEMWAAFEMADGSLRRQIRTQTKNGKTFRWEGKGKLSGAKPLIWHAPECEDADSCELVFTEGAKAAAAVVSAGFCSVIHAGGASPPPGFDFTPLSGRRIVLWADSDKPGTAGVIELGERLRAVGVAGLRLVHADEFDRADAADYPPSVVKKKIAAAEEVSIEEITAAGDPSDFLGIAHVYRLREDVDDTKHASYRLMTYKGNVDVADIGGLTSQTRFRNAYAEATGALLKKLSRAEWEVLAQAIIARREDIYPGHPAHPLAQSERSETLDWIDSYTGSSIDNLDDPKWAGTHETADDARDERILRRRSFEHKGVVYVFLADFCEFLRIHRNELLSSKSLGKRLRDVGWDIKALNYTKPDGTRSTARAWRRTSG